MSNNRSLRTSQSDFLSRDFTLKAYKSYLQAILSSFPQIITFLDFFTFDPKPESFCIIRHDVDRKPMNALKMAELEMIMGIRSTYYFRTKHSSFNPNIIKSILNLGHDIGYHYECLSDTNGIDDLAIVDFEKNLTQLRKICPIHTIAMHGSPLKPYNNSEIWRNPQNRSQLKNKYNIIGDLYIDIDYSDIAYITDTGRNWLSSKYNIRDKVDSHVKTDFLNGRKLYDFLRNNPHPKLIFQVHPERWSPNDIDFILQLCIDKGTNFLKLLINAVK